MAASHVSPVAAGDVAIPRSLSEAPGPDAASPDPEGAGELGNPSSSSAWPALTGMQRLALLLTLSVVTISAIPRLPRGVCHADSGGFQLAAAVLGITHPPGYAGYVSIWHAFTRLGDNPAYAVSIACLLAGLGALTLLTLFQYRLGVQFWAACAVTLVFALHPRAWHNLVVPEVYMTSLCVVAASLYLLLRYARLGRRKDLYLAAGLFGLAVANRLPTVLLLPFILLVWGSAWRRWDAGRVSAVRSLIACAALAALPGVYSLAYLWVRDTPQTPYNYLEQFNADTRSLPESTDGWRAKWRRVSWHHSGEQFRDLLLWHKSGNPAKNTWQARSRLVLAKWRWTANDLWPDPMIAFGLLWVFLGVGAARLAQRRRALSTVLVAVAAAAAILFVMAQLLEWPLAMHLLAWRDAASWALFVVLGAAMIHILRTRRDIGTLLAGLALSCLFFVSIYRVYGLAADLLPVLFVAAAMVGHILSAVFPVGASRPRAGLAVVIFVLVACVMLYSAPRRHSLGLAEDASRFLARVDLPTLPPDSVICTTWGMATPLWYAALVQTPRPDIYIVNAPLSEWDRLSKPHRERPVFATDDLSDSSYWPGSTWKKEGNLWRLVSAP